MSENIKEEDLKEPAPLPSEGAEEGKEKSEPEQDPLKTELERVTRKEGRTKLEKLLYGKKRIEDQLKELGVEEPEEEPELSEDEDAPVTVGMLKRMQQQNAVKSALQMADDISDEAERELTKHYLINTIKSSGNPTEDLNLARAIVNSAKNKQVIEEISRKTTPKSHSNGSGVPPKDTEIKGELSQDELQFTKPPFNMTKEAILKTRKK